METSPVRLDQSSLRNELKTKRIRRLYYWLSYNRFTILIYALGFVVPRNLFISGSLLVLVALALVFAPYMLYVSYKDGRRGWLVAFAIIVGIPTIVAFTPSSNEMIQTALYYFPLLTFYAYCYLLRFSVGEWVSDMSIVDQSWTTNRERQNVTRLKD